MRKISSLWFTSLATVLFPVMAFAQVGPNNAGGNLLTALQTFNTFFRGLVVVLITIAVIVFFWGLIQYLTQVGEQKSEGLKIMFYGIITLFVMVALWGLVTFVENTLNVRPNSAPTGTDLTPSLNGVLGGSATINPNAYNPGANSGVTSPY